MEFMERIKRMTREQVGRAMLQMITRVTPETYMKLTLLASRLTEGESANAAIRAVIDSLQEGENSQASRMFRRVMTEVAPHCLRSLSKTLFINGLLSSSALRKRFAEEQGFDPPFTLLISPTMQCNLKCVGCYAGRYGREKGLSKDLVDRILGEARDMGTLFIVFSGGEPLTRRKELFELIRKYNDMYFMFYTNGTLIGDDVADQLYDLGNAGAVISLEGFEKATDARRGKGVYRKVMDTMGRLKDRGVPFGTSLTVTGRNIEEITSDEFFEHLYNQGVMVTWFFLFMPVGQDPDVSLMPTPEQRKYLRRRGQDLRSRFPMFIADFWNDAPYVGGCIAGGRNYLHITPRGDVEPCVFTHVAVEKIYDKSLTEVLNSDLFKYIRSLQPYSENLLTPCMIIDHPHIFRDVCRKCGAYGTHEGADDVRTKIQDELDDYGRRVRALFDPVWQAEKAEYGYGHPMEAPPLESETQRIFV
jgi:MoaA/NifB/PqqE/SkfB family radical SAM enzyme